MRILALFLGLAGLIPFITAAAASWLAAVGWHAQILHILAIYTALILSFLGGVHWGAAFNQTVLARRHLLWGVVLVVLAWGAVLLPWPVLSLSAFVLLLLLSWRIDRVWLAQVGLPIRYAVLRTLLTAIAAVSLLLAIGSYSRVGIL